MLWAWLVAAISTVPRRVLCVVWFVECGGCWWCSGVFGALLGYGVIVPWWPVCSCCHRVGGDGGGWGVVVVIA